MPTDTKTPVSEMLRIKAVVRERDGQKCRRCGMTADEHKLTFGRKLHVHRLRPGAKYTTVPARRPGQLPGRHGARTRPGFR